jgi:hypothetical protein
VRESRSSGTARPGPAAGPGGSAWRDRLFLQIAVANGLFWLFVVAVEIALPVYLKEDVHSATWMISLFFVINTLMVTVLQLPVSKLVSASPQARTIAWGGLCYAAAFILLPLLLPAQVPPAARVLVLVVAITVCTVGEMLFSVAAALAATGLAPPGQRGSYLAVSHLMQGVAGALAPLAFMGLLEINPSLTWATVSAVAALLAVLMLRLQAPIAARAAPAPAVQ